MITRRIKTMTRLIFMLIAVACVGMFSGITFAQDNPLNGGTIRGTIADLTQGQKPIEGVEIKIVAQDGTAYTTKTDANGDYKKSGIPAGRYTISIYKEGYNARSGKPVTIVNGGDHYVPFNMTEKGNFGPRAEVSARRADPTLDRKIESLLQGVAENIGKRYNLDEPVVKALRQSIFKSIQTALTQDENLRVFAKAATDGNVALLELLLLHPSTKPVFTKHLTDTQLKDYLKLNRARQQRHLQATVHQIAVLFDQELSLTTDQRQRVEQLLLDTTADKSFLTAMSMMIDPLNAVHLVHYQLKISLDEILSQTQSKIWHGLVKTSTEEPPSIFVRLPGVEMEDVVDTAEPGNKDNTPESQERIKQMQEIAEAKLKAHTELLGLLNKDADQRLQMVTKGVVQQYMETQGKGPETVFRETAAKLRQAVEAGEITHEKATEKLEILRGKPDITDHPLYQQTIKDVLSEDAFKQYRAHQTERDNLRQQALRDRMVAIIDSQLLLDETQRNYLETVVAQLTLRASNEDAVIEMFIQLPQQVDAEMLNPWQRREFRHMFGPPMMEE
ncbi:carboxypeptidase regulatory-like domain-containing protein [Candidatus Poribacteria bacterium]|nr:carboxypeptidase regulatory-like domain-containing protein [Candidatus Poribacteria bacterium]MYK92953.1 carboxypeptidase regulatory-like domain-containing protein [Candidatus Poribacteria bacterium]